MNLWQIARQLRYLLRAATWPDGDTELAFGTSVYVSVGVDPASAPTRMRFPACLITPGTTQIDPDQAELEETTLSVTLLASVPGDWTGEAALLGAARANGQGSSGGRGLLELEEILRSTVGRLDGTSGIRIQVAGASEAEAVPIEGAGYAVARRFEITAWCSSSRTYEPVRGLAASENAGTITLTWTNPATRYDLLNLVLRRASGSTAPATVTDGTGVTLGSSLPTTVADAPGVGTWSYALFAAYDETASGTADRYSAAATVTKAATA